MSKNKKENSDQIITIDGEEHLISSLSKEQLAMINHINDLDRKINTTQFNLEQLKFGKQAFVNGLSQSLESEEA